mmetsp:Transcript_8469/g.20829  ORF Transcript_8469/g.20829 Transcript_8469/m.20829 type:complete len:90 (-) Transcript_8469:89-358(-)
MLHIQYSPLPSRGIPSSGASKPCSTYSTSTSSGSFSSGGYGRSNRSMPNDGQGSMIVKRTDEKYCIQTATTKAMVAPNPNIENIIQRFG